MRVSDECQNQGLGIELFRRVVQVARDEKLVCVDAELVRDNVAMKKIARKLGFGLQGLEDSTSIRAVFDL